MGNKTLVLGYFGYLTDQLDGQTVKTRNLYQILKNNNENVDFFDTQEFKKSKFSIFTLLNKLLWCNKVYYLPAHNNLKYIFPVLFLLSRILRFEVFYFVVGGWLSDFLKDKKLHVFFLRKIKLILTETQLLKDELKNNFNIGNSIIFPNFKFSQDIIQKRTDDNKVRLVFLSRINRKKGLDFLFLLSERLKYNKNVEIMCYGPINEEDREYFEKEIKNYSILNYGGIISFDKVVNLLATFDFFIFPTKYYTEGLPGVIIEAYFSGIPVVATNWKYSNEFIENGKSGFITEWDNFEDFYDKVKFLIENPTCLNEMKVYSKQYGENYSEKKAWEVLESIKNNKI